MYKATLPFVINHFCKGKTMRRYLAFLLLVTFSLPGSVRKQVLIIYRHGWVTAVSNTLCRPLKGNCSRIRRIYLHT